MKPNKLVQFLFCEDGEMKEETRLELSKDYIKQLEEENGITLCDPNQSSTMPPEVILRQPSLNVDKIQEYKGETVKKFEFRPQTWEQFVGQTEAKARIQTVIKKVKRGLKSHFLVDGIKGHGKTTYVELFAKSIDAHIIKRIGSQIDEENLVDIVNEINNCPKDNIVFFVDEIDTMDKNVVKNLNPIIESFEIAGKRIKPFIFAGATINKHTLIKNNPDTLDRIPTHIKFVRYNAQEINQILTQYLKELYPTENIDPKNIEVISKNCKFNPRTSIGFLEEFLVEEDIQQVLKNCHVIKDGLTAIDIKLLTILNEAPRAMGANALAMKTGLCQDEYLREFEPFLVEYDYINRVPSRVITKKGKAVLKNV